MSKSVVFKEDRNGKLTERPKVCPDFRSGLDEAVRHTGPLSPGEKRKAREAIESPPSDGNGIKKVTVQGDNGNRATVHEVNE